MSADGGRQSGLFKTEEHGPSMDRRTYRLATQFYGAICAYVYGDDQPGTSLSVPTCEKVPTSSRPAIPDHAKRILDENEVARDTFLMCYRRGVGDAAPEELAEAAAAGADHAGPHPHPRPPPAGVVPPTYSTVQYYIRSTVTILAAIRSAAEPGAVLRFLRRWWIITPQDRVTCTYLRY